MSLRDQFLKSGLITKKQANKLSAEKKRQDHLLKKDKNLLEEAKILKQKEEQDLILEREIMRERDRELNKKRDAMLAEREKIFRARQIINTHAQNDRFAEQLYFFQENKTVRRVCVTESQREMLARGVLAIARPDENIDDFVILPRLSAKNVLEICPEKIIVLHSEISNDIDVILNLEKEA